MKTLHIDIETYSDISLQKSGLHAYVRSPSFQILLFSYCYEGEAKPIVIDLMQSEAIPPEVIEDLANPEVIKMAHNAAFEVTCINKFYFTPPEQWRCTMIHAYYLHLPGSLGKLGDVLGFAKDKKKDRAGKDLIRYFCLPCKPTIRNGRRTRNLPCHDLERWELFKEYNRQDVVAEMAIADKLSAFPVPDDEWQLWYLDQQINRTGINTDAQLIDQAIYMDAKIRERLEKEAVEISGLDNPNSTAQLKGWLEQEIGEELQSIDKAAVAQLIKRTDDASVQRMLEIRQQLGKSSVKKFNAMAEVRCPDGRVRGLLQHYGTGTGRWAGRLVQVQNLARNSIDDDMLELARNLVKLGRLEDLEMIFGNVPDTLSQLIRTAFIPSPGARFIVADFSAIEARVIAWLAGEEWRQEIFATTGKIYEASAAQMFHVPIETIVHGHENYKLRQKGKVAELALGYQGSSGALIAMGALKMGLTEEELPEIVQRWRESSPRIVALWYAMESCAIEALRTGFPQASHGIRFRLAAAKGLTYLIITLPSGRELFYASPFLGKNQWDGDQVYYYSLTQNAWAKTPMYGGKWVENIVQAIARDCLAISMQNLAAAGYQIVMHIHDEVVIDAPNGFGSLAEAIEIMRQPIDWAPGLLLNAAGFEAGYYKKD